MKYCLWGNEKYNGNFGENACLWFKKMDENMTGKSDVFTLTLKPQENTIYSET